MVTFNTDLSGGTFTNSDLKGEYGYEPSNNIKSNLSLNSPVDQKIANMQANANKALGNMSEYEEDFLAYYNATGGDYNTAKKFADQNAQKKADASMFADLGINPKPIGASEAPTQGFTNPLTALIKGIFGVDEFTGSFEEGKNNDQQQQATTPMPMPAPNPVPPPVLTPTEPKPSPNPDGLFIRPNMLNQVPDSYSQAFKDANQAYMQNVALRPSDFREKIDLRGFEELSGLLGLSPSSLNVQPLINRPNPSPSVLETLPEFQQSFNERPLL